MMVREVQRTSKTIQAVSVALGCLPEVKVKSLLLKLPCTLNIGLRKFKLDLPESLLGGLALRIPGAVQATKVGVS